MLIGPLLTSCPAPGDSLFPGGVGNTFGDDAAFAQPIDEVSTKIFDRLPDDTWFYPGMGTTRRSAPSGHTSASGGNAAGE